MNNPFDFFDKIYCLNLPDQKERWKNVSKEFEKVGILDRVERIWATPPDKNFKISSLRLPSMFGCGLSHLKALMHAMHENVDNVLIFEDDVVFTDDILERLNTTINELPDNWDILFLGGNPRVKLNPITKNLTKPTAGTSKENVFRGAFAYAVKKCGIKTLCDLYLEGIVKSQASLGAYDGITSILTSYGNGYIITPYCCTTNPCKSIIQGVFVDYKTAQDKEWMKAL